MSEQNAPTVNAARYVVPVELDMTAANAALDRFEERVARIAGRLGELRDQGGTSIGAPQPPGHDSVPAANAPTPAQGQDESATKELRDEVKRNTDAVQSLRDAVDALSEAMSASLLNEEL